MSTKKGKARTPSPLGLGSCRLFAVLCRRRVFGSGLAIPVGFSFGAAVLRPGFPRFTSFPLGRRWGAANAHFFDEEDFREAKTAAGEFAAVVIREEFDALFAHFREENVPGELAEVVHRKAGAIFDFPAGLLLLAAAGFLFATLGLLLAAAVFFLPALLVLLAALLVRLTAGLVLLAAKRLRVLGWLIFGLLA